MKIELDCKENKKYARKAEVYALCFHPADKTFRMPYFQHDFLTEMPCPVTTTPILLQFQSDRMLVSFEKQSDADAFGDWLEEAEKKAQYGYSHMPG